MAKTFKQYRDEWMGAGRSDNINYCMPVNIGVISQINVEFNTSRVAAALEEIMKQLKKWFGKFTPASGNGSATRNELIVMRNPEDENAGFITDYLEKQYGATVVFAKDEDIKNYCWLTIAAWDGVPGKLSPVYQIVKGILSTADTRPDNYKLRFPGNRPVFQIVLPDRAGTLPEINYTVREIYPHMLETIRKTNDNSGEDDPWFSRSRFIDPTKKQKKKDSKRRNFVASAKKLKKFNKKIISFSKGVDEETQNIYDLLPWHHHDKVRLPACVDIANLREIYYDIISMHAQQKQKHQNIILLSIAFIGMFFFALYSDLEVKRFEFLVGYLVFIAGAYLFYWIRIKGSSAHNRYLEFRALAEGMRVQCYWYASGINESVGDNYTVKFQKDMFWATQAFNAWYMTDFLMKRNGRGDKYLNRKADSSYVPNNDIIKAEWLGLLEDKDASGVYNRVAPAGMPESAFKGSPEQLKFYNKRMKSFDKENRKSKRRTIAVTIVVFLLTAALAVAVTVFDFKNDNWIVFAISLLNYFLLFVTTNNSLNAYGELASKYSYCKLLMQKAVQDYEVDPGKAKQIFKQIGIEALEENAEWLMIKNDREPAVPQ